MLTKEEFTKIVNLIVKPWGRGSCAGAWSYSEHTLFLLLFLSTLGYGSDKLSI